ncbi:quinone oxidoreductase [Acidihalobacter yilgarnensis]|uniref:NADPH:quinone reductase n=1 Tax=Acidihalobacter yilgarnensis TaxID=2819280 RepID=A0A1D8IMC8_9GAMM|nr:quinone oxidoreductase [Acidihalobacter yilgarnensis]AOU97627.1 quinone oxidoreductase [Acidihalobacter yilgarnensis]
MSQAIRIHRHGGPEVMRLETLEIGKPGEGEVLLRQRAIGLNYIDIYHRTGLYPVALPAVPGMEGAACVEAVGRGVVDLQVGDRVAYAGGPIGAYAQMRVMPVDRLVKLPEGIDDCTAASMMLQGMTVQYLIRQAYRVSPSETVLWHAAAGGVGLIACQWLRSLGVTVIGTVGTDEKAALAMANGCSHVINYRREHFVERVRELTDGAGVPVVYDSVGKDTFEGSLDCLQRRGLLVSFGNASGAVLPFSLGVLAQKGSLYVTRPNLAGYTATRDELLSCAGELFEQVLSGAVKITTNHIYPLAEAAQAHRDLEARKTTGSIVLLP